MKREGKQHGMVRLDAATARTLNRFQFPATTGSFTRVSTKPTNHSKITGKCGRSKCSTFNTHPPVKAKDKGKGTQKIRHSDLTLNRRLISCKVVDHKGHHGLNYVGVSASEVLGRLCSYNDDDGSDYDDEDVDVDVDVDVYEEDQFVVGFVEEVKIDDGVLPIGDENEDEDEEDDDMGFCDVGFVIEQLDGEDGWCLVGELGDD